MRSRRSNNILHVFSVLWVTLFVWVVVPDVVLATDLFLLTGQSNMIGWSVPKNEPQASISLQPGMLAILENPATSAKKKEKLLYELFKRAAALVPGATNVSGVATAQTKGVMALYKKGLTRNVKVGLPGAYCSFLVPNGINVPRTLTNTTACGSSFGHELLFSHRLVSEKFSDFYSVKVAKGGTRIHEWTPPSGVYWPSLKNTIQNTQEGNWKLIVYHQGENDAVTAGQTKAMYKGNLTSLVANLRSEMFIKSPGSFRCKEEIPVIVVRIHWPSATTGSYTQSSKNVQDAQTEFVLGDSRARLVNLDGLTEHYHLNAPSLMISGDRIASSYLDLLSTASSFSCPA